MRVSLSERQGRVAGRQIIAGLLIAEVTSDCAALAAGSGDGDAVGRDAVPGSDRRRPRGRDRRRGSAAAGGRIDIRLLPSTSPLTRRLARGSRSGGRAPRRAPRRVAEAAPSRARSRAPAARSDRHCRRLASLTPKPSRKPLASAWRSVRLDQHEEADQQQREVGERPSARSAAPAADRGSRRRSCRDHASCCAGARLAVFGERGERRDEARRAPPPRPRAAARGAPRSASRPDWRSTRRRASRATRPPSPAPIAVGIGHRREHLSPARSACRPCPSPARPRPRPPTCRRRRRGAGCARGGAASSKRGDLGGRGAVDDLGDRGGDIGVGDHRAVERDGRRGAWRSGRARRPGRAAASRRSGGAPASPSAAIAAAADRASGVRSMTSRPACRRRRWRSRAGSRKGPSASCA